MPAEVARTASDRPGGSYLVRQFCAFYSELTALKRRLAVTPVVRALPEAKPEPAPEPVGKAPLIAAQAVSRQLLGVLELQAIEAQREGGRYTLDVNHEAQYVMAALADEILLNFEWPGREVWTSCLLEESLFGSRIAGDQVFDRIDELLRTRDPARRDLSLIYLLALSLGFQGRFRGSDCSARMQTYRTSLFRVRFGRDPNPFDQSRQVAPQAYAFTVGDAVPRQVPHIARWITILVVVLAGMLGLSQLVWEWKADPLIESIRVTRG